MTTNQATAYGAALREAFLAQTLTQTITSAEAGRRTKVEPITKGGNVVPLFCGDSEGLDINRGPPIADAPIRFAAPSWRASFRGSDVASPTAPTAPTVVGRRTNGGQKPHGQRRGKSPEFETFLDGLDIVEIAAKLGHPAKKIGAQNMILCPFHAEKSPSCSLVNQPGSHAFFKCHGCGVGGDAITFYAMKTGATFPEAVAELGGSHLREAGARPPGATVQRTSIAQMETQKAAREKAAADAAPVTVTPAPESAPDLLQELGRTGKISVWSFIKEERTTLRPVKLHVYRGANGRIHNYQSRTEWIDQQTQKRKKTFVPLTWTEKGWTTVAPTYRIPYNYEALLDSGLDTPILIAEGEKAADRLIKHQDELGVVILSWLSGSKSVHKTDWTCLQSRRVIYWPDADEPGAQCAIEIEEIARRVSAASCRILKLPEGKSGGWDAWDAMEEDKWTLDGLKEFIDGPEFSDDVDLDEEVDGPPRAKPAAIQDTQDVSEIKPRIKPRAALEMAPRISLPGPTADSADQGAGDDQNGDGSPGVGPGESLFDGIEAGGSVESEFSKEARQYWSPLGYSVSAEGQIILHFLLNVENREGVYLPFGGRALKDYALIDLAPLAFWQRHFGDPETLKVDWLRAADAIQTEQRQMLPFAPARLRGSGAWLDDGQIVINQGKHLLVDGEVQPIEARRNGPIYMRSTDLPPPSDNPLTAREGDEIVNLLTSLRWEDSFQGLMLAGWVMLAQICGALSWRPHVWLRGGPGSGKSTLLNEIVSPLLPHNILVTGPTTEAGLRQNLKSDARPVLFDEAEGLDEQSRRRIQGVIELARIASREMAQATIMKGTSSQSGQSFKIRTMFLFSAIGTSMQQQADIDRITVLSLLPRLEGKDAATQWQEVKRSINKVIRSDTGVRLLARAIKLAPILFEQQNRFAAAAAETVGSMRLGEQLGILLMGSWFLGQDEPPSDVELATLVSFLSDRFDEQKGAENSNPVRILHQICAHAVRIDVPERGSVSVPLGALIEICYQRSDDEYPIGEKQAARALKEHGLLPLGNGIVVSNNHPRLKEILKGSPFEVDWKRHLKDLEGAMTPKDPLYFGTLQGRGTLVPLEHFLRR